MEGVGNPCLQRREPTMPDDEPQVVDPKTGKPVNPHLLKLQQVEADNAKLRGEVDELKSTVEELRNPKPEVTPFDPEWPEDE